MFKMYEPICVIFGTFQQCFVLNTSVTSTSNKFITEVAPPGDKINNQDFFAESSETSAFHFNADIFEIPEPAVLGRSVTFCRA